MDDLILTPKQHRFCEEYLIDLNAKQAAIRAGYSPNSAAEQGYENLIKPHVASAIAELRKAQSERTQATADQVLQELTKLATPRQRHRARSTSGKDWGRPLFGGHSISKRLDLSALGSKSPFIAQAVMTFLLG